MEPYSKRDLEQAAQFRDGVHREALAKIRKTRPEIGAVVDRYPVEAYFQQYWDYPGAWYTIVAIPEETRSRLALIDIIVQDTLDFYGAEDAESVLDKSGPKENVDRTRERDGLIAGLIESRCPNDPFYDLIAEYPDCVIDYCIVRNEQIRRGRNAHRTALVWACRKLFAADDGGTMWTYDVGKAQAKPIDANTAFTSVYPKDKLNYRKAFLYPPHENNYTGMDFVKINATLFPNGTDGLELYEWTTDWSDYFDDGREWWGTLCYTVYDKSLDRFVVILASATD